MKTPSIYTIVLLMALIASSTFSNSFSILLAQEVIPASLAALSSPWSFDRRARQWLRLLVLERGKVRQSAADVGYKWETTQTGYSRIRERRRLKPRAWKQKKSRSDRSRCPIAKALLWKARISGFGPTFGIARSREP